MTRITLMAAMLVLIQVSAAQEPDSADVPAGEPPAVDASGEAPDKPGPTSLAQAIQIAIERFGGRAAGSETVVLESGERVHEVRLLGEEGNARTVRIDPETGEIL
jgi:uncharacterized membrane protein YkoI